ncbi:MAG TPA: DUF1844 domain-containing protein [Candidatus Eremiobacteraeota bacterium]|nr:MAG: hypothetical protein BWY64_00335 [bacterium ADurb.Bin363]HPZ08192.1 DUF1844 domain-containing protein [Candidatus Eremiobacteraeota bacterium]
MSETKGGKPEDLKLPSVEILLTNFIGIMANKAYDNLGLIPGEGSKIDLSQAKLAIDVMTALFELGNPTMDEKSRNELRGLMTNIRMAYVQKAGSYVPGK